MTRKVRLVSVFVSAMLVASAIVSATQDGRVVRPATIISEPTLTTPQEEGDAVILGRVVDATGGQPISGARVSLNGGRQAVAAMTDGRGHFVFRDLPPGRYSLTVQAPGYMLSGYGQLRPESSPRSLPVSEGATIADAEIRLWKTAAISGTVFDDLGDPLVEVPVRALRRTMVRGREQFVASTNGRTDDRGMYRLQNLIPGDYIVAMPSSTITMPASAADAYLEAASVEDPSNSPIMSALAGGGTISAAVGLPVGDQRVVPEMGTALTPSVTQGNLAVFPTVFHPAALSPADAVTTRVGSGEERQGVDIRAKLMRGYRIGGVVSDAEGPVSNARVTAVPMFRRNLSTNDGFTSAVASTDRYGRFSLIGLIAGEYIISARRGGTSANPAVLLGDGRMVARPSASGAALTTENRNVFSAEVPTSVSDHDVADLSLSLRPGVRMAGRVEFVGTASRPASLNGSVGVTRIDGPTAAGSNGRFAPDGTFQLAQAPAGRYTFNVQAPGAMWVVRSILVAGKDVSNRVIEWTSDLDDVVVTFTDRVSTIAGHVQRTAGTQEVAATVVVFPGDTDEWISSGMHPGRARIVDAAKDGAFEVGRLFAGDYLIAAVDATQPIGLENPADIKALAAVATRISLAESEQKNVPLTVTRLR